jgi:hypothetical protein
MAVMPGQDPRALADRGFYGFGVDAGTGSFYDATAAAALVRSAPESGWLGNSDLPRLAFTVPGQ